ncbi:MAG: manganese efflux pump [Muribaculaceae bacterium]|nr:manganese efflux pump [Muribaculaceae bacterium]MBR6639618.1 manganese efflux pump [Muribaculaceae bacterium]
MSIVELLLIAMGLSMDAFAVSIGKGLSVCHLRPRHSMSVGLWFGGFQAMMPLIGYALGASFASLVSDYDHWIAFVLLGIIGANMIKEAFSKEEKSDPDFSFKTMLIMAIATSIDALAIGVSFAFLGVNIFTAAIVIGITTFLFSVAGIKIGNLFGCRYKSKSEFIGGVVLIIIGTKILMEHLMF